LGLLIAMIGLDPMGGFPRFTFGLAQLTGGISFVPMLIGLFALSEGFHQVEVILTAPRSTRFSKHYAQDADLKECLSAYLRAVHRPHRRHHTAIGADTAAFLSYAETKRLPSTGRFGTGSRPGAAASAPRTPARRGRAAHDHPGHPGDAATAVLMGPSPS